MVVVVVVGGESPREGEREREEVGKDSDFLLRIFSEDFGAATWQRRTVKRSQVSSSLSGLPTWAKSRK